MDDYFTLDFTWDPCVSFFLVLFYPSLIHKEPLHCKLTLELPVHLQLTTSSVVTVISLHGPSTVFPSSVVLCLSLVEGRTFVLPCTVS